MCVCARARVCFLLSPFSLIAFGALLCRFERSRFQCLGVLEELRSLEDMCSEQHGGPNTNFPSDHIPLVAEFVLMPGSGMSLLLPLFCVVSAHAHIFTPHTHTHTRTRTQESTSSTRLHRTRDR